MKYLKLAFKWYAYILGFAVLIILALFGLFLLAYELGGNSPFC